MLRWLLWIIGGLVVLLIIALFAVPPLTGGMVAGRIVESIERETGRDATIESVSWRLLPSPSAQIEGLAIANVPDGQASAFLTLGTAEADVALWPLISGNVVVESVVVSDLTVALEEAEDGSVNWAFQGAPAQPGDDRDVAPNDDEAVGGGGFGAAVDAINVSGVSVTFTRLPAEGPDITVADGRLTGSLTQEGAVDLDGGATVNGQPVDLTVHADQIANLMAGQGSLAVDFQSPVATAQIDGSQSGGGFAGTVDVQVPSITAVADFLSMPADERPPFETLSLTADLAGDASGLQVDNINLAIDDAAVTGSASFAPGPPQRVTAQLQASGFDLAVLPTTGTDAVQRIGGLVDAEIDITAEGDDAQAMQQTVDGTISVRVRDGLVHASRPDGGTAELEQLNATFSMAGRDAGTDLSLNAMLDGRAISIDGSVGSVEAATEGAVPARFTVTADQATFSFDGHADAVGQAVSGTVDVNVPSLSGLMAWLGMQVGDMPIDRVSANGAINAQGQTLAMSDLSFSADDLTGTANLTMAGEPIPTVNGSIALGRVDVDALSAGGGGGGASSAGGSGAASGGDAGGAPASRYDMLNEVAIDLDVSAEALAYSGVVTGPTSIDVTIDNGALALVIADTAVNDGSIGGSFSANAADRSIGLNVAVAGVAARPFLSTFADTDWLSGTASIDLSLTGAGETRSAILSSLGGNGSFMFRDGSIDGINIAGILRDPVQALSNPGMLETLSTDFAELSATTTIANGLASTNDLVMLAPIFRMTGEGTASLPASQLDFLFVPTLVATLEGQGGQIQDGLAIPIRVTGSFDNPQYRLEINPATIESLIENPQGAIDALRGLSGEGGVPSLDQLLPGAGGEDGGGGSPQQLLEGLGRGLLGN
ncbi:MAG: AsmA family protein [Pseudomonadota bacterium]